MVSIPSNGSIQFLHQYEEFRNEGRRQVSIPSNGSIQFLPGKKEPLFWTAIQSQSPQTGQFNSYLLLQVIQIVLEMVSIPSNGSIQFLHDSHNPRSGESHETVSIPSNGSIQFLHNQYTWIYDNAIIDLSQSPQTGQFNSYRS